MYVRRIDYPMRNKYILFGVFRNRQSNGYHNKLQTTVANPTNKSIEYGKSYNIYNMSQPDLVLTTLQNLTRFFVCKTISIALEQRRLFFFRKDCVT